MTEIIDTGSSRHWIAEDGILRVVIDTEAVEMENALASMKGTAEVLDGRKLPAIVDIRKVKRTRREARIRVAEMTSRMHTAIALIVTSGFSRVLANVFIGVLGPSVPTQVFTSEEAAVAWIQEIAP